MTSNICKKELHELLSLCFKLKQRGHDVFFDFSSHVSILNLYGYFLKWEKNKDFYFHESVSVYDKQALIDLYKLVEKKYE